MIFADGTSALRRDACGAAAVAACGGAWLLWPGNPYAAAGLGLGALALSLFTPAWALVLLALTAPFELAAELPGWGTVHTSEVLLAAITAGAVWNLLHRPAWRRPVAPAWKWLWPFALAVVLSAAWAHAPAAGKGALRWFEFILVFLFGVQLLRRGGEAQRVVWGLVLAACLCAAQGIGEAWAGPQVHPGLSTINLNGGEVVRAAAGYGPNTLAIFLALLLPFAAAAALFHPRSWGRLAGILASGIMLCGLLMTFSLTGISAVLAAALVLSAVLSRRFPRQALAAVLVFLIAAAAVIFLKPAFQSYPFWVSKLASFGDRVDYARVAWRLFTLSPWLGAGPGLYRFLAPNLGAGINPIGLVTHPHSLYLSVLAELGLAGAVTLLWALAAAAADLIRRARRLRGAWDAAAAWALTAGLAGFAFANLTEHALIHDRGVHAALAAAAALVLVRRPARTSRPERARCFDDAWREDAASARTPWPALLAERRNARAALYGLLARALEGVPNAKVLELGCGPALDSLHLAGEGQREVHALDGSRRALELAASASAELGRSLHLHRGDVRRTGLPDADFDLVFSQGLLEHFPRPGPVWEEMFRLLKSGGWAVVDVPQALHPYTLVKFRRRLQGRWPWGWETQYTRGALAAAGREYGFKPVAAAGYGYWSGKGDFTRCFRRFGLACCPRAWRRWEGATGSWWMMNLAWLFHKP